MNETEKDAEIVRLKQLLEAIRPPSAVNSILTKLLDARPFHPFIIKTLIEYEFPVGDPSEVEFTTDAITITLLDGDIMHYYHIPLSSIAYITQTRVTRKSRETLRQ